MLVLLLISGSSAQLLKFLWFASECLKGQQMNRPPREMIDVYLQRKEYEFSYNGFFYLFCKTWLQVIPQEFEALFTDFGVTGYIYPWQISLVLRGMSCECYHISLNLFLRCCKRCWLNMSNLDTRQARGKPFIWKQI